MEGILVKGLYLQSCARLICVLLWSFLNGVLSYDIDLRYDPSFPEDCPYLTGVYLHNRLVVDPTMSIPNSNPKLFLEEKEHLEFYDFMAEEGEENIEDYHRLLERIAKTTEKRGSAEFDEEVKAVRRETTKMLKKQDPLLLREAEMMLKNPAIIDRLISCNRFADSEAARQGIMRTVERFFPSQAPQEDKE